MPAIVPYFSASVANLVHGLYQAGHHCVVENAGVIAGDGRHNVRNILVLANNVIPDQFPSRDFNLPNRGQEQDFTFTNGFTEQRLQYQDWHTIPKSVFSLPIPDIFYACFFISDLIQPTLALIERE